MNCSECTFSDVQILSDRPVMGCRRFPPASVVIDGKPQGVWPVVLAEEWCGEFKPRFEDD